MGQLIPNVYFNEDTISVDLMDGRTITVPLVWYPKLLAATPEQREKWSVCDRRIITRRASTPQSISREIVV